MVRVTGADHRGVARRLKHRLPPALAQALRVVYNSALKFAPYCIKYPLGSALRRAKMPYRLIEDSDVVVQVGAPRDMLYAGRSRAIHFLRMAKRGKVLIVEPDPQNVRALRRFLKRHRLEERAVLFPCGAWSEETDLSFLSSAAHPAASVLEGQARVSEKTFQERRYCKIVVHVRTVDSMLKEVGLDVPKLVSITVNGAELAVLAGMGETIGSGCPYISLASAPAGYVGEMQRHGYRTLAVDDRGWTFQRATSSADGRESDAEAAGLTQ